MKLMVPAIALTVMCACGGTGTPVTVQTVDSFLDRQAEGKRLVRDLPRFGTTFAAMPTTGSASFSGVAGLIIDPVAATDADDVAIIGDARLTAQFAGNGRVTGTIDNMIGAQGTNRSNASVFDVDGVIRIGSIGSSIGPDPDDPIDPNQFLAEYRGILTTPDDRYSISGVMLGRFLGTDPSRPGRPMKGLTALDENGFSLDSDGDDAPVTLEIVAVID
ncbi:hypothetical protein AB3Y40_05215 [Yoonia sp. R2331]|uniref:hypothetical protein n=1 Tax=Yoonia sp. R2331 TaxID=3237238 RepID=UPI0034E3F45F